MNQNKKYTVITGASSGIGYQTAKAFAKRGKNLIIIARNKNKLESLKTELLRTNVNIDIIVVDIDLSVTENLYDMYNKLKCYQVETWINNAGFGNYQKVAIQDLKKVENMLHLNINAVVILSSLFVQDYQNVEGTQLINISSAGGYTIVPNAITYCASKFFVSAFTEGLARELKEANAKLQAKVLAPAATKTNFGNIANGINDYDYDKSFGRYHSSKQMAEFLIELYQSDKVVGLVDRENFEFKLANPLLSYSGK
jgi:short-subunit dehydrogenase